MEPELIVAIGALIISVISIHSSQRAFHRSVTLHDLELFNKHQSYIQLLKEWANDVLNTLSDSLILCELDPERHENFFDERNRLRSKYFSQIDSGRFFFIDDGKEGYGRWKEGPFTGISPEAISVLKKALKHIENMNNDKTNGNAGHQEPLADLKQRFVAIVQEVVESNITQIGYNSFKSRNT